MNSLLNVNASAFVSAYAWKRSSNKVTEALDRLEKCKVSRKDRELLQQIISEWYTGSTLNSVLTNWENYSKTNEPIGSTHPDPLNFIVYNVQGLNSRRLEVLELINRVNAAFVICTEVGELWYKCPIPDFNVFHEKGANKNGGVAIAIGKTPKSGENRIQLSKYSNN